MRRDVSFFIDANVEQVYTAYLTAATNKPFERDCEQKPYYSISFGVNYSFKYNMNGGACNIHFMPLNNGTAVIMRFSIAQLGGARYEKYANDLNNAMQKLLNVTPQPASYDMDEFLKPQNQVTPEPNSPITPQQDITNQSSDSFCPKCGKPISSGDRFCSNCGSEIVVQTICHNCKAQVTPGAAFCSACGTKL